MANIFLSIPILEKPEFKMIFSTYAAIQSCKDHKVRLFANENDSLISRVRNVHMSAFLNDYPECDYFICIDSDIELVNIYQTNNLLTKLISHDKDFVGGLYPLKQYKNKPTCASVPEGNIDRTEIPFDQELLPMKWLSSGCWCIKRRVLEQMVKSYPELTYVGDDNMVGKPIHGLCIPEIFEIETEGKTFKKYLSEDWSFCERWKKIGGEIFADTSIVLNHLGKVPFSLWNVQVVSQPIVKEAQQEVPSPTLVTNLPEPGFDLEGNK